jgi:hypothetical protein
VTSVGHFGINILHSAPNSDDFPNFPRKRLTAISTVVKVGIVQNWVDCSPSSWDSIGKGCPRIDYWVKDTTALISEGLRSLGGRATNNFEEYR